MSDQREWTHIPSPGMGLYHRGQAPSSELLAVLLDIIQDGLCIIDPQMDLIYANTAMQFWYGKDRSEKKCYARYHQRKEPCPDCPALRAFREGTAQTGMQNLETQGRMVGRHRLFCVPLKNRLGEVELVVEYVRDVTDEKIAESSVRLLEKQNLVLQEHLEQSQAKARQAQEQMEQNLGYIIHAIKDSLSSLLDEKTYGRLESQIDRLLDTFGNRQPSLASQLSEQEKAVARYIVQGYVSKEIADALHISKKTVDYHRSNLRKKLILGPEESLRARLEEEWF